jgi:transcriptional regulator with XRE-family HTH domain
MKTKGQIAFAKKLGKRIVAFRNEKELTRVELAAKAKMNEKYLGRVERGESEISFYKLNRIIKTLKISIEDLV